MIARSSMKRVLSLTMLALPLAYCLCLLLPASSYAHAFLIDADLVENTMRRGGILGGSTGQMDGVTFFRLIMVILVNLSSVFWVGAQLWHAFVFQTAASRTETSAVSTDRDCEQRFTQRFALPVLLLLFAASIGVLIGQGLLVSHGSLDQALSPALLINLAASGQFGFYWSLREFLVLLAFALATYALLRRKPSPIFTEVQSWVNLLIALALLFVMTSLDHTVTITNSSFTLAILSGWLYLLAVSLWVGGMFYLALVYLPLLRGLPGQEQAPALLKMLTRFSPIALIGMLLTVVTGSLNATIVMTSPDQLWQSVYGWSLLVEIVLVGCLLVVNTTQILLFRPHLAKTVQMHAVAKDAFMRSAGLEQREDSEVHPPESQIVFNTSEVKQLESSIAIQTSRLFRVVRWEPVLGVGILICMSLLTIFSSTLQPAINLLPKNQAAQIKPFTATLKTTDHAYTLQVQVSPNHIGNNIFTVHVLDNNNQAVSQVAVTIYTSMLDMDMGVDTVHLQAAGNGAYSAPFQFTMAGRWQLSIEVRAPDSIIHETTIDLNTPF